MVALEKGKGVSTHLFSKPGEKYLICQQGCWWIFVSQQHGLEWQVRAAVQVLKGEGVHVPAPLIV